MPLICLHSNGCFHGDIKPSNILINLVAKNYSYYLADFGEGEYTGMDFSTNYDDELSYFLNFILFLALRGTPKYFAPELWKIWKKKLPIGNYNPEKVDVYALGIIILELLLG